MTPSSTLRLALVGLAASVVAALWLLSREGSTLIPKARAARGGGGAAAPPPSGESARTEAALQRLEQRVTALARQNETLKSALQATQATAAEPEQPDPVESRASRMQATPEERAHADRVKNARVDLSEQTLRTEARDPEWSAPSVRAIEQAYQNDPMTPKNVHVDCRSTLCKVAFSFAEGASDADMEAGAKEMTLKLPWSGEGFMKLDTNTREGVFFVARDGHALPSVDPSMVN